MNPKAFVSYSWDSEEHKVWVADIAAKLRKDRIETILDQWHVVPGDQLPEFMEREIRENDYVLIICTPKYKTKSDARTGGVGYEGDIMTAEVFAKRNHKKFIPILAQGNWVDAAPSWLFGKYYIDLSKPEACGQGYRDLVTTIHGHRPKPPPIGKKPQDLIDEGASHRTIGSKLVDLYIKGIVVDEVTTPKLDGTMGSALYKVPFQLSQKPTALWSRLFIEAWKHPTKYTSMHRPSIASIQGDKVYLDGTTIEEIEKYHRDTLILCVDVANKKEKGVTENQITLEEIELKKKQDHQENIRNGANRIKF